MSDTTSGPVSGADRVNFGPVQIDVGEVGDARIKRLVYPPGMRWSSDLKPLVGTALCEHAHAGYLLAGALTFAYPDGCTVDYVAPAIVDVAPGHDAWVVGDGSAVLIEVDFVTTTIPRLGVDGKHRHD